MTHFVYWIKRKGFKDPYTEGYVGISNDPTRRFIEHSAITNDTHVSRSIKKYNDIELVILHECNSVNESASIELAYRNDYNIGWNVCIGGGIPPSASNLTPAKRLQISEKLKSYGSKPLSKNAYSPEAINKAKLARLGRSAYHNPITGECKMLKICPVGWLPGRKSRKTKVNKIYGIDYFCNVDSWVVTDPQGNESVIFNLKQWCSINNVKYLTVYGNRKGWTCKKISKPQV